VTIAVAGMALVTIASLALASASAISKQNERNSAGFALPAKNDRPWHRPCS
jgi:hypothetical protein